MVESHLLSSSRGDVSNLHSGKQIYLQHLLAASQQFEVRAAIDIFDVAGDCILEQDQIIFTNISSHLFNIHDNICFNHLFHLNYKTSSDWLLDDLHRLIENDSLLLAINDSNLLMNLLAPCLENVKTYSALEQHLKLLALGLPQTYTRTLYSALLSLLLVKEMRLTATQSKQIFLAALGHDLGMLTVNPLVLNKKEKLDASDWFQIQQHLPASVNMLKAIDGFPPESIEAVFDHHERCDGTGYPNAKVESEISLLGQVLGLTDSLAAIYFNRFKNNGQSLGDAAGIIQLNQQAYLHRSYELVSAILKRGELPIKNVIMGDNSEEFIVQVYKKNQMLQHWFQLLSDCLLGLGFRHGNRHLHGLQNVIIHLTTSVKGGGLFDSTDQLKIESFTKIDPNELAKQMETTLVMQQELLFHLQRLTRMVQIYLDSGEAKDQKIELQLREGFDKVKRFMQN